MITPLVIAAVVIFVPGTVLHSTNLRAFIWAAERRLGTKESGKVSHNKLMQLLRKHSRLATTSAGLIKAVKSFLYDESLTEEHPEREMPPDLAVLNSRVRITDRDNGDSIEHLFAVEVCGSIRAPRNTEQVILRVSVDDMTEGSERSMPVQAALQQHRDPESGEFMFISSMGRLPEKLTVINDWTTVAEIPLDWIVLPRRGARKLVFETSLLTAANKAPFANARYDFDFDNYTMGYLDMAETVQRTKTLAVPLVLAFCAESDEAVNLVREWTHRNIDPGTDSPRIRKRIDAALEKSADFFRQGNTLDTEGLCAELADVAPMVQRYEILDLCLKAARARGALTDADLTRLQNMAEWLEVDCERFRSMLESTISLEVRKDADVHKLLGITPEMSPKEARRQLNRQFRKWHSRVTHADPQIRAQADHMLDIIAETRSKILSEASLESEQTAPDKALIDVSTED